MSILSLGGQRRRRFIRWIFAGVFCVDMTSLEKGLGTLALMSTASGLGETEDLCDPADQVVKADVGQYWEDLKGEMLDPKLARKARQEEMEVQDA